MLKNWNDSAMEPMSAKVAEVRPSTMTHLDELQGRLQGLQASMKMLDERISPVLRPAPTREGYNKSNGVVDLSPLNEHLCGLLNQVEEVQHQIQSLMDRVDL